MKRGWIAAAALCLGLISCGTADTSGGDTAQVQTQVQTEPPAPDYKTFGKSVKDVVNALNSSGKFKETYSSECVEEKIGNGKVRFTTANQIIKCTWSGTYEESSGEIIDITISYPCDSNEGENGIVACAWAEMVMQELFDVDQHTAMTAWLQASKDAQKGTEFRGYSIHVGYSPDVGASLTTILPLEELESGGPEDSVDPSAMEIVG